MSSLFNRDIPPAPDEIYLSPYDNPAAAGFRFFVELLAALGSGYLLWVLVNPVVGIAALLAIGAATALFNTPGDKQFTGVPTPGPIRVVIELSIHAIAAWVAWTITPMFAEGVEDAGQGLAMGATLVIVASIFFGRKRYFWLLRGAPNVPPDPRYRDGRR